MGSEFVRLLFLAFTYGILSVSFRLFLRQPLISASLAFWTGWSLLLLGGLVTIDQGWRNINLYSAPYVADMFHGAFIGFLLGSLLGSVRKPIAYFDRLVVQSEKVLDILGRKVLLSLFLIGIIFFSLRVASVGLSADFLSQARAIYNERESSLLQQVGSHLSVLMTTLIISRGIYDSYHGVNIRGLFLTILAGAPLGLANGGRLFLMSYTLAYLASLLLCRSAFSPHRLALTSSELGRLSSLILLLLAIFGIMGFVRGGYGEELNLLYAIVIWPVSTLDSMDVWVYAALNNERTLGFNTLGWIGDQLDRLGLWDFSSQGAVMSNVLQDFHDKSITARVVPRSILPDLLFDFGPNSIVVSMGIIAFLLEVVTTRFPGRGLFWHVVAVQCLLASLMTVQNSIVSPGFAVSIFWGAVINYLAMFRTKQTVRRKTSRIRDGADSPAERKS